MKPGRFPPLAPRQHEYQPVSGFGASGFRVFGVLGFRFFLVLGFMFRVFRFFGSLGVFRVVRV